MIWFMDHFWLLLAPMIVAYLAIGVVVARIEDRIKMWLDDENRKDQSARLNGAAFTVFAWPLLVPVGSLILVVLGVTRVVKKALGADITGERDKPERSFVDTDSWGAPLTPPSPPKPVAERPADGIWRRDKPPRRLDLRGMRK